MRDRTARYSSIPCNPTKGTPALRILAFVTTELGAMLPANTSTHTCTRGAARGHDHGRDRDTSMVFRYMGTSRMHPFHVYSDQSIPERILYYS